METLHHSKAVAAAAAAAEKEKKTKNKKISLGGSIVLTDENEPSGRTCRV